MAVLIIGAGLVGSQIARILVEEGERPVVLDLAPQPEALGHIVDVKRITLTQGDILNALDLVRVIRDEKITKVIHTAANPLLTLGAQKNPYTAIQVNVMGTVNVLEAARTHALDRVVVTSSNVLSHFLVGGEDKGDSSKEEAFPRPSTFYAATKQAVTAQPLGPGLTKAPAQWSLLHAASIIAPKATSRAVEGSGTTLKPQTMPSYTFTVLFGVS